METEKTFIPAKQQKFPFMPKNNETIEIEWEGSVFEPGASNRSGERNEFILRVEGTEEKPVFFIDGKICSAKEFINALGAGREMLARQRPGIENLLKKLEMHNKKFPH